MKETFRYVVVVNSCDLWCYRSKRRAHRKAAKLMLKVRRAHNPSAPIISVDKRRHYK